MAQPDSLDKLVTEAGYLRDHLLRVEGQDSTALGIALQPFERANGDAEPTEEQITALATAFQDAHDKALNAVDGYTLNEVLKGRSPHSYRTSVFGSFILTTLGVLLVVTAFYFSNWASRATFAISEAEDFVEFDHFNSIMKLVELESYFEEIGEQAVNSDMEPQLVYLEGLTSLKAHYHQEALLPAKMSQLIEEVNPLRQRMKRWRVDYCRTTDKSTLPVLMRLIGPTFNCPSGPAQFTTSQTTRGITPEPETRAFRVRIDEINKLQRDTMKIAGRRPLNEYISSYYKVQSQKQTLHEWLNVVYLWALPIVYGALGSIVYCMWRVLNPNLAAVGALYAIMRTAFAGLAALTLSMLLVPSNILTAGVDLNRPIVYLLSFIFGYSIEAFVSTLNMLNTYLSQSLTPKPRKPAGGQ
ncbi:hypothetical protein AB2B41_10540 [Marimonas sp. MJW-29]|uniref:Uncharacterized protein n=1 Tax=Sulfitobacter sediminis TaxID=3234186 RepID=A0ABV3RM46_9RHOB